MKLPCVGNVNIIKNALPKEKKTINVKYSRPALHCGVECHNKTSQKRVISVLMATWVTMKVISGKELDSPYVPWAKHRVVVVLRSAFFCTPAVSGDHIDKYTYIFPSFSTQKNGNNVNPQTLRREKRSSRRILFRCASKICAWMCSPGDATAVKHRQPWQRRVVDSYVHIDVWRH